MTPPKEFSTSTTKSPNVKPHIFEIYAATVSSFRIAVAYSSSIHVSCSAQPVRLFPYNSVLVFIIVSEFGSIQGVAKIYIAENIATAKIGHEVHLPHVQITSKASPPLSTIECEANPLRL